MNTEYHPKSLKQASNSQEHLEIYRRMAREIRLAKRVEEVPRLYWSYAETALPPLPGSAIVEPLTQEQEETIPKLQEVERHLEVSQQEMTVLKAAQLEQAQQQEQVITELKDQVAQQEQKNQQREMAALAQVHQLKEENTQLKDQIDTQPKVPNGELKTRQQVENLKDVTLQGSFPMMALFVMLVVAAFGAVKLGLAVGQGTRTLFTTIATAWKSRLHSTKISQYNLPRAAWQNECITKQNVLQRG